MRLIQPELQKSGKRNRYIAVLGPWLIFVAICGLVAILFSLVTTQGIGVSSGITGQPFYCDTSDTIRYAYATIGADQSSPYWDSNLFLSVTMGFHGLTFAQAKAIDICFDLMIGRGSQVLLALATYPVLRRAVLRSMEVREFSLALLLPFFMERFSVNTLYVMIANMRVDRNEKSGSAEQSARARVRIDWRIMLVFSIGCYTLAVPTFLSAMTSYQSRAQPFFPVNNGSSYMSSENITYPSLFVTSGQAVGLSWYYPLYLDNSSDSQIYDAIDGCEL